MVAEHKRKNSKKEIGIKTETKIISNSGPLMFWCKPRIKFDWKDIKVSND